ncbi:sensor histidine kinase [Kaistella palustris]|uniref:sensor histidine kinase n=1 Tax=Kaistella palustris TaxID=493376 RepID=UPI00048931B2|nr:7TM diverse intracellular signaling domain-containing protein [Kaistella palustris]
MEVFVWNMVISFQLLFIIISSVIFVYLREKSFKYYVLYNLCLVIYVLSRSDNYYLATQNFFARFLGQMNAEIFLQILNFYIQIVFYTFYSIFALYFLDLDKRARRFFTKVLSILRFLTLLFLILGGLCYFLKNPVLYISFYTFLYLPVMLTIFVISLIRAMRVSDKHKHFFLFGVCAYVACALLAFAGSFMPSLNMRNPITSFYIGIILETIFFSLGLAYKMKLINDAKNRVNNLVLQHRHQQQITKLQGLVEGEERERKRWAEELHDGISGDLTAIKMNISYLNQTNKLPENSLILQDLSQTIEKSCLQLRELSHNLSPSSVTNHGLLHAVEQFCMKIQTLYKIDMKFSFRGGHFELSQKVETHIYRIIQELVNNIVKHSEAT